MQLPPISYLWNDAPQLGRLEVAQHDNGMVLKLLQRDTRQAADRCDGRLCPHIYCFHVESIRMRMAYCLSDESHTHVQTIDIVVYWKRKTSIFCGSRSSTTSQRRCETQIDVQAFHLFIFDRFKNIYKLVLSTPIKWNPHPDF